MVIFWLLRGTMRFNEPQRRLAGVTHRTLAKTLREMEAAGLVVRHDHRESPPRVTGRTRRDAGQDPSRQRVVRRRSPGGMLPIPELERTMLERRHLLHAQAADTEEELRGLAGNVEPELARIVRGDDGVCTSCGEPIPPARLAAVPTAEACLACAKAREIPH